MHNIGACQGGPSLTCLCMHACREFNANGREFNANDNRNWNQREYTGHVCRRWNHGRNQECTYFVGISLGFCAACGAPAAHPYNSRPRGGRGGYGKGGRGGRGNRY